MCIGGRSILRFWERGGRGVHICLLAEDPISSLGSGVGGGFIFISTAAVLRSNWNGIPPSDGVVYCRRHIIVTLVTAIAARSGST